MAVMRYGGTFSAVMLYDGNISAVNGCWFYQGNYSAVMRYAGNFSAVTGFSFFDGNGFGGNGICRQTVKLLYPATRAVILPR